MQIYQLRLQQLLERMDRQISLRLAVCFVPGVIAMQLVHKFGIARPASLAAALLLLGGAVVYTQWSRIRVPPVTPEEAASSEDSAAALPQERWVSVDDMMRELVALYGDQPQAVQAAMVEAQANASLTWSEAVAQAVRRKRVVENLTKHPSGS